MRSVLFKFIGIFSTVWAAFGIMGCISMIFLPGLFLKRGIEISAASVRYILLIGYIGIPVYVAYLSTGIFLLARKYFSVKMLYTVLAVSIVYKIFPLILINDRLDKYFDYRLSLQNLISPAVDFVILVISRLKQNRIENMPFGIKA